MKNNFVFKEERNNGVKENTSYKAICKEKNITFTTLQYLEKNKLNLDDLDLKTVTTGKEIKLASNQLEYTIKPFDDILNVLHKFETDFQSIRRTNGIDISPFELSVGSKIIITKGLMS